VTESGQTICNYPRKRELEPVNHALADDPLVRQVLAAHNVVATLGLSKSISRLLYYFDNKTVCYIIYFILLRYIGDLPLMKMRLRVCNSEMKLI